MTYRVKALLWAALILGVAVMTLILDLNQGASFGIVGGFSSAAWGALQSDVGCGRECLQ
ncbi:hypothetical protein [Erythrobacter sp. Alg231-14]|uniref:hypothetical protein n=1 Tax=Erythrobacter sp. Alg231-14 TaxID=1922225 RepID=UPI00307C8CD8